MGKYIVELVNGVPKNDKQNKYIIYMSKENKSFFNITEENIEIKKIHTIFSSPIGKIIWEQFFLPFSLWNNKIDIYHAPGFVLPILRLSKTRFIVTIADMTFFSHPQYHTFLKQYYFQLMIPLSLGRADKIIAISENTKKDIIKITKINPDKIKIVYLAVDHIFTSKREKMDIKILEKYNIQKPYILFVGMLEPRKNLPTLLKAFAKIKQTKQSNLSLVIVGKKGWLYDEIFALVNKLKLQSKVIFTGYIPDLDLPALYRSAMCLVYPSFYEGFGIPIVEAMACGCPVVTSNNSSMQEIAGSAAIMIDPNNINEITESMVIYISDVDERKKRSKLGYREAKKFTWKQMVNKTLDVYRQIKPTK